MKKILFPLILAVLCVLAVIGTEWAYRLYRSSRKVISTAGMKKPAELPAPEIVPGRPFSNHLGMRFVYIPPGSFFMGSPCDEIGRSETEFRHRVVLTKGFFLQTTEVTQAQFVAVMGKNPSKFKGDDLPVEQVTWFDANLFVERLNRMEGGGRYRLPTEAEWEYACRAGTDTALAGGPLTATGRSLDPNLNRMGWYWGNAGGSTHPVAQKAPNAWGLYDMHGNVWEWCRDWFRLWSPEIEARRIVDPKGPPRGRFKVFRGGSWFAGAEYNRCADRLRAPPDTRSSGIGFRVARSE